MYKIEFFSNSNVGGNGIVILETQRVLGGDSSFSIIGDYDIKGRDFNAIVKCNNYANTLESIFGNIDNFTLNLKGRANEEFTTIDAEGYMDGNPKHLIQLRLERIAELP